MNHTFDECGLVWASDRLSQFQLPSEGAIRAAAAEMRAAIDSHSTFEHVPPRWEWEDFGDEEDWQQRNILGYVHDHAFVYDPGMDFDPNTSRIVQWRNAVA